MSKKYTCILTAIAVTTSFAAAGAANADVFTLEGPVKTNAFRQAEFKWAVHLAKSELRVNGRQNVCMNY